MIEEDGDQDKSENSDEDCNESDDPGNYEDKSPSAVDFSDINELAEDHLKVSSH